MAQRNNILILNDDCLLEVFSHLDIADLLAVADVCERFRENAIDLFAMKHKALDFGPTHSLRQSGEAYFREIKQKLRHFGSSTTSLKIFGANQSCFNEKILELIGQHCDSKLKELTLHSFEVANSSLKKLRPLFGHLERLHLDRSGALTKMLTHSGDLKALKLSNMVCQGLSLEFRCPKLESIQMEVVYCVYLGKLFELNPQLRKLSFDSCYYFDDSAIPIIAKYLPLIEDLSLGINLTHTFERNILHLRGLTALKKLKWRSSDIYRYINFYSAIKVIATAKIPLEELELWSIGATTTTVQYDERFVTAVSTIRTIKTLCLRGTQGIEFSQLIRIASNLTKLTNLVWSGNARFNIGDVIELISKTPKLRKVILSGKGEREIQIDANAFDLLLDVALNRNEQSPLEIEIVVKPPSSIQVPAEMIDAHKQTLVISLTDKMPEIPTKEW